MTKKYVNHAGWQYFQSDSGVKVPLEVTAEVYDNVFSWYVIDYDAERNALLVVDDEDEDSEEKYGTRYIPLLSPEELIQEADRVLEGYTPPEEVLERYGIM